MRLSPLTRGLSTYTATSLALSPVAVQLGGTLGETESGTCLRGTISRVRSRTWLRIT